ncbi:MAG: hypothetical protein OXI18_13795 [bacterium]|nr:hypothetical protein [bacterium]
MGDAPSAFTQKAEPGHSTHAHAAHGPTEESLIGGDPRLSPETKAILLELVDDDEFAVYLDEFCSNGLADPID